MIRVNQDPHLELPCRYRISSLEEVLLPTAEPEAPSTIRSTMTEADPQQQIRRPQDTLADQPLDQQQADGMTPSRPSSRSSESCGP
ncbi:hypothetical protein [Nesterenkonia pannonica]|uniref:hypothetical protein n=1 Tax=Nesterenkonia pannonica TaxID=1548602 RepID=UPI002164002A|nr:hypothetical protein [Nesterenkonia pannonica]